MMESGRNVDDVHWHSVRLLHCCMPAHGSFETNKHVIRERVNNYTRSIESGRSLGHFVTAQY
jgi:hypothetical protein